MGKEVMIWRSGIDWIEKKQIDNMIEGTPVSLEKSFKSKDVVLIKETISKAKFIGIRGL
jgi:hypothetical protein